jgi:transaldolase
MGASRVLDLFRYGQSVWLDQLGRGLLESGGLARAVAEGEVVGVTSNPTIFDKAIEGGADYDSEIAALLRQAPDMGTQALYEALVVKDIQDAADLLKPVFQRTDRLDGYVSLEVSPKLAYETQATIEEARRLFALVNRPNAFIKVPSTDEGLPAITALIGEGINVNVTLMFSQQDYISVANAYLSGLEQLAEAGGDLNKVASVASFFVSRIDVAVDKLLPEDSPLHGKAAVANTKAAYALLQETFGSARFRKLKRKGARVQRFLCASTSTKDPAYSDVLYVEELIGPDTVNTMPLETLEGFRDHGRARPSITEDLRGAKRTLKALAKAGVDLNEVCRQLKVEGVQKFSDSLDSLLKSLETKRAKLAPQRPGPRV